MTATTQSYKNNSGYLGLQVTQALIDAVGAPFVAGDLNTWLDCSPILRSANPSQRQRTREETNVTGSDTPLTGSGKLNSINVAVVMLDTDGKTETIFGATAAINIFEHVIEPSFDGDITLPFRHAPAGNNSGSRMLTYSGDTKVTALTDPSSDADSSGKTERALTLSANTSTPSTIV